MAIPKHSPARPQLGSPHPSEKVLSRISSFHRPRPRLNLTLPLLPPRSPPAALRQAHRAQVLAQRRAAKKNKTLTEFTRRAILQAQGNAKHNLSHSPITTTTTTAAPTTPTTATTTESPITTASIAAAENLTEILPHQLPSRRRGGASGFLSSPRPVFALSPARGAGSRSMIPLVAAGSPLMYREVVKRPVMLPIKAYDGGGRGRKGRILDWLGGGEPRGEEGGERVGSVKKEVGAGEEEVEG